MPVYEYRCPKGHTVDRQYSYANGGVAIPAYVKCTCGEIAARLAVPSRPPVVIGDTCVKLENQVALRDKAGG